MLVASERAVKEHNLKPRARVHHLSVRGDDPILMLTGPIPATGKALAKSGLSLDDIDLFEVNQAFASVVLRFQQAFDVDPALVNVNGGSIAMGVFQVKDGLDTLFNLSDTGLGMTTVVFFVLCAAYFPPLVVDLSSGMAKLSNTAMAVAGALVIFILLAGPTHYLMGGITSAIGDYFSKVLPHGFQTFTFLDEHVGDWFQSWTLTYMVWWIAWAPFVGVFIARISKGRTIREFVIGVILGPTIFSMLWFGIFGGAGFYEVLQGGSEIMDVVRNNVSAVTFFMLNNYPLPAVTISLVIVAAFLFIVTSVVSAAFVLGMFSTEGDLNPSVKIKLVWGVILGALGYVMILAGDISAIKSIIALGALPFVYVVLVLVVCLLKTLKGEFEN